MNKIVYFLRTLAEIFKDRIFIFLVLANLLLLALVWFFWLTKISPSGYQIYTQIYLTNREINVFLPPIILSVIVSLNFILGIFSRKREALASYLAVGSSLFILSLALVLVRHYLSLI